MSILCNFRKGKLYTVSREQKSKKNARKYIFIISFILCTLEETYIKINFIYYFNGCKYFRKANIYIRKILRVCMMLMTTMQNAVIVDEAYHKQKVKDYNN